MWVFAFRSFKMTQKVSTETSSLSCSSFGDFFLFLFSSWESSNFECQLSQFSVHLWDRQRGGSPPVKGIAICFKPTVFLSEDRQVRTSNGSFFKILQLDPDVYVLHEMAWKNMHAYVSHGKSHAQTSKWQQ